MAVQRACQKLDQRVERVVVLRTRLAQTAPDVDAKRERPRDGGPLRGRAIHRVLGDEGGTAHLYRHGTGVPLHRQVVVRPDNDYVAAPVRDSHRRRLHAVHRRDDHLDLREGAAHAVRVDERDARAAATTNGVVELSPPASIEVVCVGSGRRSLPSALKARITSVPRGSFSTITVGAPIIAEGTTNASSGTSSTETICTGP